MSEIAYAIMPYADYKGACDALRAKTGGTGLIKSGELKPAIEGIASGPAAANVTLVVDGVASWTAQYAVGKPALVEIGSAYGSSCNIVFAEDGTTKAYMTMWMKRVQGSYTPYNASGKFDAVYFMMASTDVHVIVTTSTET